MSTTQAGPQDRDLRDSIGESVHGALPESESTGFVPESTLIPESRMEPLSESRSEILHTSAGIGESVQVDRAAAAGGGASALKKNMPFVVIGVIAVGILGFFLARGADAPPPPPPLAKAAPAPAPAVDPNAGRKEEELREATSKVAQMQAQVATTDMQMQEVQRQAALALEREAAAAAALQAFRAQQAQATLAATDISDKLARSLKPASGFTVTVARNGLAWVKGPDGVQVVRVGDQIQGLGQVKRVDDLTWRVQAGDHLVAAARD